MSFQARQLIDIDEQVPVLGRLDWLICAALLVGTAFWISLNLHSSFIPAEDAAMLLRYSQHFSQGYGIRWNIHQTPVDGATDFLFMVFVGGLARLLHIDVIAASRVLNLAAHTLSVLLVFLAGRVLGGNRWVAAGIAVYLAAGPAMQLSLACFGAPFFALLLLGCWLAALNFALRSASWPAAAIMAILALLAGLTRPEGVILSFFFVVAAVYLARGRVSLRDCLPLPVCYFAAFAIFGGLYFAWHWHYFGYPLPNPYYIKGNGHLYPSSVKQAAENVVNLVAPVLPLFPLGWLVPQTRRLTNALAGTLVAFILMWILLNDWNNGYMRFQYAIVPTLLATLPGLAAGGRELFQSGRKTAATNWILAVSGVLAVLAGAMYTRREFPPYPDMAFGMRAFALRLRPLADKGYTMVVTEAGTLPFYSEWQIIDGLGLNDRYMAHNGHRLTTEYLDPLHPEIMMVHIDNAAPVDVYRSEIAGMPASDGSPWGNMGFINYYARSHGYTLAAAWGSDACNLHMYWVRPGFADYDAVLALLRQHPYNFLDDGRVSTDFRDRLGETRDCEHS